MRFESALLVLTAGALVWSGIGPYDRATWLMEVAPVLIGAPILIFTWRRARLSRLLYSLIFLHALILILGGHYTYARVPLGDWVGDLFGAERNHYDRFGHFVQGFIPALLTREVLLRWSPLERGKWLFLIVVSICLAFSAFYELVEWWAALGAGEGAKDFLGTQGDVWDTQWDMALALVGAIVAQLLMGRAHDASLAKRKRSLNGIE